MYHSHELWLHEPEDVFLLKCRARETGRRSVAWPATISAIITTNMTDLGERVRERVGIIRGDERKLRSSQED